MGQLVYDYGPHNVNPDIFSEEKEKNEKLYFLAYPTDKENDFTTSIEKFKERLTVKYKKYVIVRPNFEEPIFYSVYGKTSGKNFEKVENFHENSCIFEKIDIFCTF